MNHTPDGRPTRTLPLSQLITLSIYWFGIVLIWGGLNKIIVPAMIGELPGGEENLGVLLAIIVTVGVIAPILIQPTIGTISDYTVTRWGRRKPYIVIGALLDVVFLVGIATSETYLALVAFYFLLQLSSNFAQGPFQGYVPDLVPAPQEQHRFVNSPADAAQDEAVKSAAAQPVGRAGPGFQTA